MRTVPPNSGIAPGSTLWTRAFWTYHNWKQRMWPQPSRWTFNASPGKQRCGIHAILNQATQVGGTTYLVEKVVAPGTVMFGHDTPLKGAEWIAAFEHALQNDQPEWWDSTAQKFQKGNLVFLRYNSRIVLILSPETAARYQAKHPKLAQVRAPKPTSASPLPSP